MDSATFQAAMAAVVVAAVAQINPNGTNGSGSRNGTNDSTNGENKNHQRVCTYKDFANCKPMTFRGDGGVIALTRWFEKTESVFEISTCPEEFKVKYAACTFSDAALSWWNGHVKTMTLTLANFMGWERLKKMMLEEYCPRGEFNDLAVLCPSMVTPESQKVERFIWGLSPQIQGNVEAASLATYDSAKRLAQRLVDHCVRQGTMTLKVEQPKGRDDNRKPWNKGRGQPHQENTKQ
ncbi:hypothetical protein L2E82_48857 [Cichorium intybus]|uniref:Uncharacterized protein n=1 Tax=Cichorium intybus TaxID=13427 RepID=A0ACB8YY49_CICIN|nr:hypothetical protein L2E82_48857 [Cichorium intybus]